MAPRKPKLDLRKIGSTGLPVWAGRVYDEISPELQGERGRRLIREMAESDPIIGGVLFGIETLARSVPWSMTPADNSNKAKKVADFVDECLSDLSPTFGSTLSEILSMLQYGWSWHEIVYKRREGWNQKALSSSRFDDGKIGWASWAIRGQETLNEWLYEEKPNGAVGELLGMQQLGPPDYNYYNIPRQKSLHFVTRSRRENPEGISILRNCFRPWYFKNNIEKIEGIGIERDLAGLPVMYIPPELFAEDADDADKALFETLQKIVTSIKRDEQEGLLIPMAFDEEGKNPLYKLELLSTGGERQFDTNAIINRYDERIAMSMLADFILMGHQAVGSFALSTTKTGLFTTALSAFMDIIAEEINLNAIPRLVLLNGWDLKYVPTLQHGKIEAADLGKLGDFIKKLADSGMQMFPTEDGELEAYLLKQAGLPGDPGAGKMPLPGALMIDANGNPTVVPPTPGVPQLPAGPTALPSGATTAPKPVEEPSRKPAASRTPKVASEAKAKSKHFTPLAVRFAAVSDSLEDVMEPSEFSDLALRVLRAKKFSSLSEEDQEQIVEAEAAS